MVLSQGSSVSPSAPTTETPPAPGSPAPSTRLSPRCRSRNPHSRNPRQTREAALLLLLLLLLRDTCDERSRVSAPPRCSPLLGDTTTRTSHPGAGWEQGGRQQAPPSTSLSNPPQPHAQGSVSAESGGCRRWKTTWRQSPGLGRWQEPPHPMGGTQHPASPGVTPSGTPRDRDHSPGDTRPQRHRLPLCRRTWVLGTRDAPWGHHWCPCPPGQMGYGGPGCSPPPFTSCQLGQGGEALSALARVAISVISRGWGQGTAARTSTGAAPLCPSRTNAADRVMGAWPRHRGGTAGTCTAATRVSLITALRSTRTSAGEWHREPSATRCPVLWGTHGSVRHDVPP